MQGITATGKNNTYLPTRVDVLTPLNRAWKGMYLVAVGLEEREFAKVGTSNRVQGIPISTSPYKEKP